MTRATRRQSPARPIAPIRSVEREWPWLPLVYALGFFLSILFSALAAHPQ
jgi:hypothetical protein